MTKQEIVDNVSAATGLTKVETEAVMNGVMALIIDTLSKNERIELRGFGTFAVKHRQPKKAETIYLEERYVPTFKPAKKMRLKVLNTLK
ncbi:HU family DNA-binding protein [Candidatus Neomarinimicrobiota bacterium]